MAEWISTAITAIVTAAVSTAGIMYQNYRYRIKDAEQNAETRNNLKHLTEQTIKGFEEVDKRFDETKKTIEDYEQKNLKRSEDNSEAHRRIHEKIEKMDKRVIQIETTLKFQNDLKQT